MERYGEICRAKIPQDPQGVSVGTAALASNAPGMSADIAICLYSWGDLSPKLANASKQNVIVFGLLPGDLNDLSTTGSDQAQAMQSICKPSRHCRCSKRVWYFIILTWCFRKQVLSQCFRDHTPGFRAVNIWQSCFRGAFGVFGLTWDNRQYNRQYISILKNRPISHFRKAFATVSVNVVFTQLLLSFCELGFSFRGHNPA